MTLERSGLLAVDKPAGPTSHDVVARVRRALGAPGAGHLGTLDPPATGLLLVAVGAATRCLALWQGGEKTYDAAFRFGIETATHDLAGAPVRHSDARPGEAAIREASRALTGDLLQVPPMVSAIKVGGRRLHVLAREGRTVERAPRPVRVAVWDWLEIAPDEARARIRCSGGTYVRALARDLGRALGCGSALASLRRLRSEPFGLERSVSGAELLEGDEASLWAKGGIPLDEALAVVPSLGLTAAEAAAIGQGRAIARPAADVPAPAPTALGALLLLRGEDRTPLALAEPGPDAREAAVVRLQPRIVFPWAVGIVAT